MVKLILLFFCLTVVSAKPGGFFNLFNFDFFKKLNIQKKTAANEYEDIDSSPILALIERHGYTGEEHYVTTQDGYILGMHRILPNSTCTTKKRPILMQHGILTASFDWIVSGPNSALGYILSDECHDIWLGNSRGNKYSRNHTKLDPDQSPEFWDFDWHEMGMYDSPAEIDYVLSHTGSEDLYFVAHSQGTSQFFVMASERPEYNKKVRTMFALAPIAYMEHSTNPLFRLLSPLYGVNEAATDLLGIHELFPDSKLTSMAGGLLCHLKHPKATKECSNMFYAAFGYSEEETNPVTVPFLLSRYPSGISTKQIHHFTQLLASKKFNQYDYGAAENQERYNQPTPPEYQISNIATKTVFFFSKGDVLADDQDVITLYNALRNNKIKVTVDDKNFAHGDFITGKHAKARIYDKIIEHIREDQLNE